MKAYKLLPIIFLLLISSCATPPEVKQLSIKQMEYFDSAISAISKQSEALIMATDKLVKEAKARIDEEEQQARLRLTALIQHGGLDKNQATTLSAQITDLSTQTQKAKKQLDSDIAVINAKTHELNTYLKKMKEVHIAMDSYLQSQKAGEKVVSDVLNQPSVNTMLAQVSDLTPKIVSGLSDIKTLLGAL